MSPNPPDDPAAARRAEILAAAARCFARSGFHGASMKAICAEAGMSPGNIYHYFASKDAIIAAIVVEDRAKVRAAIQQAAEAPVLSAALAELYLAYFSGLAGPVEDDFRLALEVTAEIARNADLAEHALRAESELQDMVTGLLRAAQADGRIAADRDPALSASLLLALGDGLTWRLAYGDRTIATVDAASLAAALAGLLGERPRPEAA